MGVFLTAAYRLAPSLGKILSNIQKFQYSTQSAEKLSIDKEKFKQIDDTKFLEKNLKFSKGIYLKNISYTYNKNLKDETSYIFKDVNLEIKRGSKIGIIGASGSGKSTLIDLLMGIITPQKGEISIDNDKLNLIKKNWFKVIGCVPQDVFILDESLKKNIAFGLQDNQIDTNKVNKALEFANLVELKNSLKYGLDTLVGEKGSRLSGGQRQRIGIARALYNDPDILFFDEATNALDETTEKKVISNILQKFKDKILICISHNKSLLGEIDNKFKIENKQLVSI